MGAHLRIYGRIVEL